MNESTKTVVFILTAIATAGLAYGTYSSNVPKSIEGFERVGQAFFEEFESASQITALELFARDEQNSLESFVVKKTNGLWTIPSHSNYPAEAAERLADTTTSVIGLEREAVAGRLVSEHAKFGVLDPKDENVEEPENTGKRITLLGEGGTVLADFIIGKRVESEPSAQPNSSQAPPPDAFYVRRADENQTYIAPLSINISTRFSDWIDTKLLPIDSNQIKSVRIDNYDLQKNPRDPLGLSMIRQEGDKIALSKADAFGPWEMNGLDPTKEELNSAAANALTQTLSSLKIVGVRPKFRYQGKDLIGPDMKLIDYPELRANPQAYSQLMGELQVDLAKQGFNLQAEDGDIQKLQLVSESGGFSFTTTEGIVFTLDLGKAIDGDRNFLEIGTGTPSASTNPTDNDSKTDELKNDAALGDAKNRYVMIRVTLDPSQVGDGKPVQPIDPTPPQKPVGYEPPKVKAEDLEAPSDENKEPENLDVANAENQVLEEPQRDEKFIEYDVKLAEYEQAKTQFEIDSSRYAKNLEVFEKEVADSQKQVDILNQRFGAWYYVISATNLGQLRVKRDSLVTPVEPQDSPENIPSDNPPTADTLINDDVPKVDETPAEPNPESDTNSGETKEETIDTSLESKSDESSSDNETGTGEKQNDGQQ